MKHNHKNRSFSFESKVVKILSYFIGIDKDDNFVIPDYNGHQIVVVNRKGDEIMKFGSRGSAEGHFDYPLAATIDHQHDGNIIIADNFNHRIQVFDRRGQFLFKFGSRGSEDGKFSYPRGVTIDEQSSNIVVSESENHRVQVFNERGQFLFKFGSRGSEDGQFEYPSGVAVDQRNRNIVIADTNNNRVQVFDQRGNFLFKFGFKGMQNLFSFGSKWMQEGQFDCPYGVAVTRDREGTIIVADYYNHRVQVFDERGRFICKFGSQGSEDGRFQWVRGVAVLHNGDLVCSDEGSKIQIFKPVY